MGFTRDKKIVERFLETVESRLLPLAYKQWYPLRKEESLQLKVRLQRAGHILGSAYVELDLKQRDSASSPWKSHRTVFSGDLGAPYAPLLPAPKSPYKADTLVIESTYGNRVHESRRERKLRLKAVVERALADGGTVLIPAFSIGRTQELIYEFESIVHDLVGEHVGAPALVRGGLPANGSVPHPSHSRASPLPQVDSISWQELPIIVDSPLAAKFTKVYRKLKPYWDEEALQRVKAGRHPLSFENLITVDSHEDHMRLVRYLAETRKPAIVIAASGMAAGGRIVNYLKAMLGDARHNVLFVGYQVKGTPGYQILKASRHSPASRLLRGVSVELDGEWFEIKAGVESIGGDSAHADRENLLTFVRGMRRWPSQVRIVHGGDQGREGLRSALKVMGDRAGRSFEIVLPKRC